MGVGVGRRRLRRGHEAPFESRFCNDSSRNDDDPWNSTRPSIRKRTFATKRQADKRRKELKEMRKEEEREESLFPRSERHSRQLALKWPCRRDSE